MSWLFDAPATIDRRIRGGGIISAYSGDPSGSISGMVGNLIIIVVETLLGPFAFNSCHDSGTSGDCFEGLDAREAKMLLPALGDILAHAQSIEFRLF